MPSSTGTIELAIINLEAILRSEFPAVLAEIEAEWNDGIRLPEPVKYEWEEIPEKLGPEVPIVIMIGEAEDDIDRRDQLFDATVRVYIVTTDRVKRHLTKKVYRYADALKRILRKPFNRTLSKSVTSAKVIAVRYSPTFLDRDNVISRDISAEVQLRVQR